MRDYEKEIILNLLSEVRNLEINLPVSEKEIKDWHTGFGYYLEFNNESIPNRRIVLDKPFISGNLGGVEVGFVAFIENSEFSLECYSFGESMSPDCSDHLIVQNTA